MGESNFDAEEAKKYEWELCRENVRPMKHGRRVEAINKALSQVACNAEKIATAKLDEYFEQAEAADDPLAVCFDFCRWFEDSYPSGKQRLYYQLLWKIVHKYIQNGRYEQDPRSLKIWESLADTSMGHGYEVYQHAHQFGCLSENADFYIRWARDLEDRGAIATARETLHKGRLNGAVPLDALNEEEDQLEMREMRRQLNRVQLAEDEDSDGEWENNENGETRKVFTRVATLESGAVPVIRLPSVVGDQGSKKLAEVPKQQVPAQPYDVFEDDEAQQENYLERIYDLHSQASSSYVERYALKDSNTIKLTANPEKQKKPVPSVFSSFEVFDDDKENIAPDDERTAGPAKPRLVFKKRYLHVAMEEDMAEKYYEDAAIKKRLNFDDD